MQSNPYLIFNGQCEAAFKFYEQLLGARITFMQTWGDSPKGIHVTLHFKDPVEGERIFQALAEGGKVEMPFQPTFFAAGFGMCADRYGIPWMVHCGQAA